VTFFFFARRRTPRALQSLSPVWHFFSPFFSPTGPASCRLTEGVATQIFFDLLEMFSDLCNVLPSLIGPLPL